MNCNYLIIRNVARGLAVACLAAVCAVRADLADFVDPFVGTAGTGHTTPAAAFPFGMVQAGPTTGTLSWRYCSGYQYEDKSVTGYALTALSGTGFCEYNELQILPFSGPVRGLPMSSAIDKADERAEPGYYAARQVDDGVSVEIAVAKRAAFYRFTWDKGREPRVLVNLPYGNGQWDGDQLAGSHDGKIMRLGGGIIEGEHFRTGCIMRRKIAFALEFDRPWTKCEELPKNKPDELPRYVLSFDIPSGKSLSLKADVDRHSDNNALFRAVEIENRDIRLTKRLIIKVVFSYIVLRSRRGVDQALGIHKSKLIQMIKLLYTRLIRFQMCLIAEILLRHQIDRDAYRLYLILKILLNDLFPSSGKLIQIEQADRANSFFGIFFCVIAHPHCAQYKNNGKDNTANHSDRHRTISFYLLHYSFALFL